MTDRELLTALGCPANISTVGALGIIAEDSGLADAELVDALHATPNTLALLRQGGSAEAIVRAWRSSHPVVETTPEETEPVAPDGPEPEPFRDHCPTCGAILAERR